jgi:hypothetical protein
MVNNRELKKYVKEYFKNNPRESGLNIKATRSNRNIHISQKNLYNNQVNSYNNKGNSYNNQDGGGPKRWNRNRKIKKLIKGDHTKLNSEDKQELIDLLQNKKNNDGNNFESSDESLLKILLNDKDNEDDSCKFTNDDHDILIIDETKNNYEFHIYIKDVDPNVIWGSSKRKKKKAQIKITKQKNVDLYNSLIELYNLNNNTNIISDDNKYYLDNIRTLYKKSISNFDFNKLLYNKEVDIQNYDLSDFGARIIYIDEIKKMKIKYDKDKVNLIFDDKLKLKTQRSIDFIIKEIYRRKDGNIYMDLMLRNNNYIYNKDVNDLFVEFRKNYNYTSSMVDLKVKTFEAEVYMKICPKKQLQDYNSDLKSEFLTEQPKTSQTLPIFRQSSTTEQPITKNQVNLLGVKQESMPPERYKIEYNNDGNDGNGGVNFDKLNRQRSQSQSQSQSPLQNGGSYSQPLRPILIGGENIRFY